MQIVKVPENREKEFLQAFQEGSMFTFEGLDISDKSTLKPLESILRKSGFSEPELLLYYFTGKVMNKHYGLTGSNAYPDDITIVVIPEYYNPIVKLQLGARWFDDIVYNNAIRQNGINGGIEPDYGGVYE